jgi:hypothetical protein
MGKLTIEQAASGHMPGFVFETETGKVIGWFDDSMKARAFSASQNRQQGKGYCDWANTNAQVVDQDLTFAFLDVDHPYMLRITDAFGTEVFMDYNLKPEDGKVHFDNMLKASEPGLIVRFIDMETDRVVREAKS